MKHTHKELKMDFNEEEAWLYHTLKDFEYIVNSGKYGTLVFELLGEDTKQAMHNMLAAGATLTNNEA